MGTVWVGWGGVGSSHYFGSFHLPFLDDSRMCHLLGPFSLLPSPALPVPQSPNVSIEDPGVAFRAKGALSSRLPCCPVLFSAAQFRNCWLPGPSGPQCLIIPVFFRECFG